MAATAQAGAELPKSIWRAKDRTWNDYLKILRGVEVWRAATFANPQSAATVEALTDRNGIHANSITEKEETLRPEFLSPKENKQYFELLPAAQGHQSFTDHAAEGALFAQLVGKARGMDKLSFGALRLLWEREKKRILELLKAVVGTGRHRAMWKWASEVVIPKAGMDDYMKLMAYRSISLLCCMGKVIEEVVAELMGEEDERRGLRSDGQYGSRKRRSTIDVAAIMVNRANIACSQGHIAGVLLMDFKAAFLSVGRRRLIHAMR